MVEINKPNMKLDLIININDLDKEMLELYICHECHDLCSYLNVKKETDDGEFEYNCYDCVKKNNQQSPRTYYTKINLIFLSKIEFRCINYTKGCKKIFDIKTIDEHLKECKNTKYDNATFCSSCNIYQDKMSECFICSQNNCNLCLFELKQTQFEIEYCKRIDSDYDYQNIENIVDEEKNKEGKLVNKIIEKLEEPHKKKLVVKKKVPVKEAENKNKEDENNHSIIYTNKFNLFKICSKCLSVQKSNKEKFLKRVFNFLNIEDILLESGFVKIETIIDDYSSLYICFTGNDRNNYVIFANRE